MLYKPRTKPSELSLLKALDTRMNLSEQDKQHLANMAKGYEGECLFDARAALLQNECFILNDLLLPYNNSVFQIDSLILLSDALYLIEVKNFSGDFYYEHEKWYRTPHSELADPLLQLGRSESLLRRLLKDLGCRIPLTTLVVFINPEFTLYQAPRNKPFILPTQLNSFFRRLDRLPSKLTDSHRQLASRLAQLHLTESPYQRLPTYEFDQLNKGISCPQCLTLGVVMDRNDAICLRCGHIEPIDAAILRCVKEFQLLFPEQKISTNRIHDWCKVIESKRTIRRVLSQNFMKVGVRQWTYYE
ncbi:nuclease [Ammoniphilus oxalaticus]|uniref:Nuclease n=2 Tax=Ammoniphilus oxalaticus TaxID=66863 RepID=A0A419SMC8_9BACL|nr:nuclease [Ammoniphilus oxalaticus]